MRKPGYRPVETRSRGVRWSGRSRSTPFPRLRPSNHTQAVGLRERNVMRLTPLAALCGLVFTTCAHAGQAVDSYLGEIVVTAKRFEQPAPIDVTVIKSDQIAAMPTSTLPELLSAQAGIHVRSADGSPDHEIDLRGFGKSGNQNTLILLNGQRLNEMQLTAIPWSAIPLDAIDRIEIQRGSGAVLYGGGATGGVINIITKVPGSARRGRVGLTVGSYDTVKGEIFIDRTTEQLGFNLSATSLTSDNYRTNNEIDERNLEAALRLPLSDGAFTFRLGGEDLDLGLPGARSRTQLMSDRRGTATPRDFSTRTSTRAALIWDAHWQNTDLKVDLTWRNNRRTALFDDYSLDGWDSKSYIRTDNQVVGVSPRLRMHHGLLGAAHVLVAGLDWDQWDYDSRRYTGPETVAGVAGATNLAADISAGQDNRAAYFSNETRLGTRITLSLGGRLHRVDYSAQEAAGAAGGKDQTLNAWEAALAYDLDGETRLYGRLGRSFRVPTVDEIYNQFSGTITPLEPQTSRDSELGMEWKRKDARLRVTAYHMDLDNEIHFNAITFTNMNLSPTRRYGVELEAAWPLTPAVGATANYTWAAAKFRSGSYTDFFGTTYDLSDNNVPLVPRHRLSLGLDWRLSSSARVSAIARYVGKQRFDNDQVNSFAGGKMPAYTLLDLKYIHESGPWRLSAAVHNLLDEKYFTYAVASTTAGSTNYNAYPAAERNFIVTVEYRF